MALPIFQRTVVNDAGSIIPSAQVEVRLESNGSLATLYSDRAGTVALSNPFTAGSDGFALFYADPNEYKITAVGSGGSVVWRYVVVIDTNDIAIIQDNISTIQDAANTVIASGNMSVITSVSTNITDVQTVSNNITDVQIAADTVTTAGSIVNIATVSDSIGNVNSVGSNINGVNSAYANMSAIIDAQNQAVSAAGSAATAAGYANVLAYNFKPTVKPTIDLNFAENEYEIYDGFTNSFTKKPLADILTVVNGEATGFDARGRLSYSTANKPRLVFNPDTGVSDGLLVEEARTNLVSNPRREFLNAGLSSVAYGSYDAIDGTLMATRITGTDTYDAAYKSVSATQACSSVLVKDGGAGHASIGLTNDTSTVSRGYLDFSTGLVTVVSGQVYAKELKDGWWRLTAIGDTPSGIARLYVYPGIYSVDTSGSILIDYFQIESGAFETSLIPESTTFTSRASTGTYYDSTGTLQTAAIDTARISYNPADLTAPGKLLLEGASTNMVLRSEDFSSASWSKTLGGTGSAPVVTANHAASPDGTTTADRVVFTTNGGTTSSDFSHLSQGVVTVDASIYSQFIYIKSNTTSSYDLELSFNGQSPIIITATSVWTKYSISSFVAVGTAYTVRVMSRGGTGSSLYADVLLWGSQFELNYPTSYIPTTTAQVTRAADVSSSAQTTRVGQSTVLDNRVLDCLDFKRGFTIYFEMGGEQANGVQQVVFNANIDSTGYTFRLNVAVDNAVFNLYVRNNPARLDFPKSSDGLFHKYAITFKNGVCDRFVDGVLVRSSSFIDPNVTRSSFSTMYLYGVGTIASLTANNKDFQVFPKALSSAEAIALTS